MHADLKTLCISPRASAKEAIAQIDKNGKAIILITDKDRLLLGTVSDGDIRRAILAGIDMNTPISEILKHKKNTVYPKPVTALVGTSRSKLLKLMEKQVVRQIPLLDAEGHVVDLVTWEDLLPTQKAPLQAVIMAGGFGTRLRPLTDDTPKAMLPVNGKPMMELILDQLREADIQNVNVTTHYKHEKITSYFGDGNNFGVKLNYVKEDHPLGTGGGLGLMDAPDQTLLVINCDILTQIDFHAMLLYHLEYNAQMTVAVRQYGFQVPYGVIECEGEVVQNLVEKPYYDFFINAGIYLLEPSVYRYINSGEKFNMTDLIGWLLKAKEKVVSFPIVNYWLDIGKPADYKKAQTKKD